MNEVAKANGTAKVVSFDPKQNESIAAAETFIKRLNDQPLQEDTPDNTQVKGKKYIPISVIENKLDELFLGLWQIRNFRWQVIANEVVGSIELGVYHPILKDWIWREGAASTMILQKSGAEITDIGAKHKNTLVKDFPHLKSACLKNAAQSLGKIFGRDLNRNFEDEYIPITEQIDQEASAIEMLEKCETGPSLNKLWALNKDWQKIPAVITAFKKRKAELKGALNG